MSLIVVSFSINMRDTKIFVHKHAAYPIFFLPFSAEFEMI
jgi:hypothetical protein